MVPEGAGGEHGAERVPVEGPGWDDGAGVLAAHFLCSAAQPAGDAGGFPGDWWGGAFRRLDGYSRGNERVLFAGADVWEPEEVLPQHVAAYNAGAERPYEIQISGPKEFEDAVARRTDRPVISGEMNPVFQGIYSTRIEVKQALRRAENQLLTAETLGVLAGADREREEEAWEPVLFKPGA